MLEYLKRIINRPFRWSPFEGITHTGPTLEPYITIKGDAVKPEGQLWYGVFDTEEEAVRKFIAGFFRYASPIRKKKQVRFSELTLYWRVRPQIRKHGDKFYVRARLLLSNEPINADFVQGNYIAHA